MAEQRAEQREPYEGEDPSPIHPTPLREHAAPDREVMDVRIIDVMRNWRSVLDVAYTSPETAYALVAVTPKVLGVTVGLLVLSFLTTHLLPGGFIWGVFAAAAAMMAGFFWLCSNNALKLHEVPEKTRRDLRRGMVFLLGLFLFSVVSMAYFFALGLKLI